MEAVMPAKKPSKPVKAKKTVSPKAAPAKKPAAKPVSKAAVRAKPAAKPAKVAAKTKTPPSKAPAKAAAKPAKAVAKEAAKAAKPEAVKKPLTPAKPAAKTAPQSEVKMPAPKSESKPEAKAVAQKPAAPPVKAGPKPVVAVGIMEKKRLTAHATDGDEEEGNPNLLSGPRNVTPYQVKRGEQYMNKEQLDHFRQILASWKRDLMVEVDRTVLHMKDEAANFPDPNDRATQESEFSLELRTRDRERKLIRKIEEALQRVEDGSYGYCVETGEEIGVKRLEARPVATLSVEAQERRERREKQYGDRDDRYR
jgi:DnaK suppressor protein